MRTTGGSITRLDSKRYLVSVEVPAHDNGKRRRKSKTIRGNRRDAERALARLKLDVGKIYSQSDLTISDFWEIYYAPDIERRLATRTIAGYKYVYHKYIEPCFGDYRMEELKARDIERMLWRIEAAGSQNKAYTLLRQLYNAAYNWELIDINPMSRRINLKKKAHYEPDTYRLEELDSVLSAVRDTPFEVAVIVCLFAGLRKEEALALTWEDISFSEDVCIVNINKAIVEIDYKQVEIKSTKTAKSTRRVFLTGNAAKRIRELYGTGKICAKNDTYLRPNLVSKHYKKILKNKGVRYVPFKNLRTTYATIQMQLGVDSALVSSMLGHSNYNTAYKHYFATNEVAYMQAAKLLDISLPKQADESRVNI